MTSGTSASDAGSVGPRIPRLGLLNMGDVPPSELVRRAALAEGIGYTYFWIGDERFFREPYQLLALTAAQTSRIIIGPCVTDPYTRHPALTAEAMATLAEISDSRAVLVFGAGHSGFREMGIQRGSSLRRLREAIDLVRRLLPGEPVSYTGDTIVFNDGVLNTLPGLDVPIWLATEGPRTLELAGATADVVMLGSGATPASVSRALAHVATGANDAKRPAPPLHLRLDIAIAEERQAALDTVRPIVLRHLIRHRDDDRFIATYGLAELQGPLKAMDYRGYSRDRHRVEGWARLVPDEVIGDFCWAGAAGDIRAAWDRIAHLVHGLTFYPVLCEGQTWDDVVTRTAAALGG